MTGTGTTGFEEQLARLQEIVRRLETGELPLEEGVALYKEGLELAAGCRKRLQTARNDIKVFSDGVLKDFDMPEDSPAADD
ncbi:Exonuclease VII small subunit [Oleidesulfovibrio alaskensis G20]|jgi:exodeoxyribonuclease VII small subunit|uniref:Exodeoxyribonuclease 7 small subunit n=1 Tax=Oleidesulfovibrio alaskensis (strain ATCC BAA-1058 / DSM 17464 / G20) TaxID=207559 RepID=EX7S_OLEA2|nr:exodeoxyribonuclease VII small subunit [Oleidesulfovibrio alaskensis]Q30Z97.1 RecName: Full=Exodeoxyribonuclease 7 small subunit; AltName: Full=Exodeoxyribonuclease VII small subunit; Short=Exonuclease VII small subunit [Oleidesulfovibrio alaskensis G20]ABB38999.1 Exonuclease VII small subunit [Oleidesulfovibrio alaskensis G20]MBG0772220.1 exodeoxyribonuclease VII small subunit [Oleidesulfovibrio alaskensis]MBL3583351.1 exodeoxyribonuclease VII small subunit [Oleidesulfovibrio alaskensis]